MDEKSEKKIPDSSGISDDSSGIPKPTISMEKLRKRTEWLSTDLIDWISHTGEKAYHAANSSGENRILFEEDLLNAMVLFCRRSGIQVNS